MLCVFPLQMNPMRIGSIFFLEVAKTLENSQFVLYNKYMATVNMLPAPKPSKKKKSIRELKKSLAELLADQFRYEFQSVHLSGQLLRSINVSVDDEGNYQVEIPPQIYDVGYYKKYGIIKHISQDSYAIDVNITGGFSGLHKDYLAHCLNRAIMAWAAQNGITKMNMDITRVD